MALNKGTQIVKGFPEWHGDSLPDFEEWVRIVSKNNNKTFNPQYDQRNESELMEYPHTDNNGRFQWWARPGSKSGGKEGKKIYFGTFPSEVRPEFVTDEALEMIVHYCTNETLSLGAQSGSDRMLKEMRRGHTVDDVVTAVERCTSHRITPNVDFIFGYPDETEQDQQDSLKLIKFISKKGGSVRAHYLTPLPDTPYADVVPSKVGRDVKRTLGRMALDGNLTGVWE